MKTAVIPRSLLNQGRIRFEGKFYLNDDSLNSMKVESHKDKCILLSSIAEVFNPPIFKRQFCKETVNSVQYFQSSDVPVNTDCSEVFVYKPQVDKIGALVNKDDILVTGFGTIGNVRIVSRRVAGSCFANNVCRIRSHNNKLTGFYYAFLASKYGRSQLNKNASGAVVRYIEAPGIKKTLVPVFPEEMQKDIDKLIRDAASLRDKAAELLSACISEIEAKLQPKLTHKRTGRVAIKDINNSHNSRFEANYHISDGSEVDKYIRENFEWKSLSDVCLSISRPDIFKRYYVQNGIPFLGGSDIFLAIPDGGKYLSKTKTSNIPALKVENGWILMPRSGTIGNVVLSHDGHAQKLVSEHVIRLVPNDILRGGYVYAFLSSSLGKALIQRPIFGAVIQHVESPHLSRIPIPVLKDDLMDSIHERIMTHKDCLSEACKKELKAISMVEAEIESWDKNKSKK